MRQSKVTGSPLLHRGVEDNRPGTRGVGIRTSRLSTLAMAADMQVPTRVTAAGRVRRVFCEEVQRQLLEAAAKPLPRKQLAKQLGISVPRLAIVEKELPTLKVSSLELLISALCRLAAGRPDANPDPMVSWATCLRHLIPRELTGRFLAAVQSGQLSVSAHPGQAKVSPKDLWLTRSSVIKWRATESDGEAVSTTICEAAQILGIREEQAYHLAGVGLLRTHTGRAGLRRSRVVASSEIERFRKSYAPLKKIADCAGVPACQSYSWAVREGLKLVAGPEVDRSRQYWVRLRGR